MFGWSLPETLTVGCLGLIALIGLAVLAVLAVRMFQARSLVRRELGAYFLSPIAYVAFVVFLAMTGYLFGAALGLLNTSGPAGTESPMQTMYADKFFWAVFLVITTLLTMRSFAEERGAGTLEVLLTAPLRDWQVVLGKYAACLGFYCLLWLPTLAYLPALLGAQAPVVRPAWTWYGIALVAHLAAVLVGLLLLAFRVGTVGRVISLLLIVGGAAGAIANGWLHYHNDPQHLLEIPVALDPYPVLSTYLGMFLAGAMFLALGLFVSSMVRDQLVAALISLALGAVFIAAGFWPPEQNGELAYQLVYFFSVPLHFDRAFTRGVIDTRPLVLYASTTLFCLFLTVRSLERRRWA